MGKSHNKKHKKYLYGTNSTITRIVLVIFITILPINILTLVLSEMVIRNNQNSIYKEVQINLQNSFLNFKDQLASSTKRLTFMCSEDSDFKIMEYPPESIEKLELSGNLYNARKRLQEARQEYQVADMMYTHFRERDYTIINGYMDLSNQKIREMVDETAKRENVLGTVWEFHKVEGKDVLMGHSRWNQADYGVIVNLESALNRLHLKYLGQDRHIFFTNYDGTICSESGQAYMQEQGMTLEQLQKSARFKVLEVAEEGYDLQLIEVIERKPFLASLPKSLLILESIALLFTLLAIPVLLMYVYRWVNQPLKKLVSAMDRIEGGDLDFRIEETEGGREFEQINRNFNNMMKQVNYLKIESYEKELEKKEVKMRYLSQQVQPHFILNAMNILYSYEPEEYPLIQKMILCLSKYFRYIVRVNSDFVELSQEMDHIRNYFEIQRARYPNLFFSIVEYEESLARALVPPLLVQNFAENAIKYSLRTGNKITIFVVTEYQKTEGEPEKMRIRLADTGEGISDELLEKIRFFKETCKPQKGLGVGIQNSIERLKYLYEEDTEINIGRDETYGGTTVEIILPIHFDSGRSFIHLEKER